MREIPKLIVLLIILVFLQIFVFNTINLGGYINPYIYLVFILILPFETPGWLLLLLSFFLGISIDSFMGTLGIHASAMVFMAFMRHYLLSYMNIKGDVEKRGYLNVENFGFTWALRYVIIMVFVHHFVLFFIESFTFSGFFHTLWRVILSTISTSFFILLGQYFFARK